MTLEFKHKITQSEVNATYINLKDEVGIRYGAQFPPHKTKLVIIDQNNRKSFASKHYTNQIWGNIKKWYEANQINSGVVILIKYDPNEKTNEGEPIIHLKVIERPTPLISSEEEEIAEEERGVIIPIDFERQLEDFIEVNLELIEKNLRLFKDENGNIGRQYPTDVGTIDLLCVRPNKDFVVIELKRDRASDKAVGQISRYMGWVKQHLANNKNVYGFIITHEYNSRLSYAIIANDKLKLLYYKIRLEFVDEKVIQRGE